MYIQHAQNKYDIVDMYKTQDNGYSACDTFLLTVVALKLGSQVGHLPYSIDLASSYSINLVSRQYSV